MRFGIRTVMLTLSILTTEPLGASLGFCRVNVASKIPEASAYGSK